MITIENKKTYRGDGIYIGRPSLLGNPFKIGEDGMRDEVIQRYRVWLWSQIKLRGEVYRELERLASIARRSDLTLICWCKNRDRDVNCHGDLVKRAIEWLNSERQKQDYLGIQGLVYLPRFLPPEEQVRVLTEVDREPWLGDLKRRVQHYGYKYDYRARTVNQSMRVGPLPPFAVEVARQLMSRGLITEFPDQLIVNEYQPGQGISAHVDCVPCFKNTIVTVSLGSTCEMDFVSLESGEVRSTVLEPGSALVLRDAGRYQWMHRIEARKIDHGIPRSRRVSLTYRNVILSS